MKINIEKSKSILDKLTLSETVDIAILDKLLGSDIIQDEKERIQLLGYRKRVRGGIVGVTYKKTDYGIGRVYPEKALSLAMMRRTIRHTLVKGNYIDIDMENCQPTILKQLCDANDIPINYLNQYITGRSDILKEVMTTYEVNRDDAKLLFISLMYYGSFDKWLESIGKYGEPTLFITNFIKELKTIGLHISSHNPELVKIVKKLEKKNEIGSVVAIAMQDYECRILEVAYTTLKSPKNAVLTFDGIMIPKSHPYDLVKIEQQVLAQTGFKMKFLVKEMNEEVNPDNLTADENSFTAIAKEFEKTHFLIINKAAYIHITSPTSFQFLSFKQLVDSYRHMTCLNAISGKPDTFIQLWANNNPDIRKYTDCDTFPPPLQCPEDIYNLWQPFAMELVTEYSPDETALQFILTHIKILCNHDNAVYEYFIRWIGQFLKFPAIKTICPIFISEEGTGKGSLMKLVEVMIGGNKYFESRNPGRDVWGGFNPRMADSFFVHLSEIGKKQTMEAIGEIKGLITDRALTINVKGLSQFETSSFHRFILNTNKNDPIATSTDDRRNLIIRSSDELIKSNMGVEENANYFTTLHKYIDDINVVKTCFEYLINLSDLDKFHSLKMPTTEHQEALRELDRSLVDLFMESYTLEVYNPLSEDPQVLMNVSCSGLFDKFSRWKETNRFNFDINSKKFGLDLKFEFEKHGVTQGVRTNKGNTKSFDWLILAKHYNIYKEPLVI